MSEIQEAAKDIALFLSFATDIKREAVLYEDMFCSPDTVKIANQTFPETLSVVRRCVFVSVLTRMSAMFDPPASIGRDNFSFAYMRNKYSKFFGPELEQDAVAIEQQLERLQIKSFRNKMIAHHDRLAVFGDEDYVHKVEQGDLPELLDSVIELFCSLIDRIPNRELITMTGSDSGDFATSDNGSALIHALKNNK